MIANVNGTELHYELNGTAGAPWLVFSHSLASSGRMWDAQVAAFRDRYQILTYDLRGHGRSGVAPAPYSLDLLADDVLGLLDALRIDRCVFVGLSLGGMIGQILALRQTGRFEKLVFADTSHSQPPDAAAMWEDRIRTARTQGMTALVAGTMGRWFTERFRDTPAARQIADIFVRTPVEGYVGGVRALMPLDTTARLGEITVPSLAVAGDADGAASGTRSLAEHVPGARFVSIPDAAHLPNVEQPERFNEALREFLRDEPRR